jgi:amino acid transporter
VASPTDDHSADELAQLGYRQELRRGMSAFSSFAISFSVISILTGGVSLYGYGLSLGGPIEMTLGWPLVALMTTVVCLSLAELASAYPTAGALYHWSAILGGPRLGFYAAWLNLVGQVGVVAGVDYAFADFLVAFLGWGHERKLVLSIYALCLASHGLVNHVGLSWLEACNRLSAGWHVLGTAVVVGLLLLVAPHRPASFLLEVRSFPVEGVTYPLAYAALVGLLQAQWTFTGYDASAHTAEETVDAARAAPRGMLSSVISSAIVGWVLLVALTLSIRDLGAAAAADNAFSYVVTQALGPALGRVVMAIVLVAMWFCGLASVTSNSRMLFALARDGGVPRARAVARVGTRFQTPHVAVWVCVVVALLLAGWGRAYSVIVSISTIGLYGSYGLPILAGEIAWRRRGWRPSGPFRLRASRLVARLALVWIALITVLFVLPPNQRTGYTFAGLLVVLLVVDLRWARRHFRGPAIPATELQTPSTVAMAKDTDRTEARA